MGDAPRQRAAQAVELAGEVDRGARTPDEVDAASPDPRAPGND